MYGALIFEPLVKRSGETEKVAKKHSVCQPMYYS